MFDNSFNQLCRCEKDCSFSESTLKDDESLIDNNDWESKYDISISVLKEEYLQSLYRIRNVDEKANKYLLVISILMTGSFVVLSSPTIDSLEFNHLESITAFLLTLLFLILFIASIFFGALIFKSLLNCFKLVETKKMPDLVILLNQSDGENSTKYKDALINHYQEAINVMSGTTTDKQAHVKKVSKHIEVFIISLFCSLIILIILKLIG